MKTKKKTWAYALLLCMTLSICTNSYSAEKKETKKETSKKADDITFRKDLLELLILTRSPNIKQNW